MDHLSFIKKFVQSVRSNKVSDEFVDASFDILPDKFKKSLSGKGNVTSDKKDPNNPNKPHKDIHYLGKDEGWKCHPWIIKKYRFQIDVENLS